MSLARIRSGDWVSIARIGLAFVFVASFRAEFGSALILSIIVAGLAQASDHLDGYLIRRAGGPSLQGWLLDSVADRAFYVAAILAFQREFGTSEIATWLFVMREIILYSVRVLVGDFDGTSPRYRGRAIFHAAIIRISIVVGCLAPCGILPAWASDHIGAVLSAFVLASALIGYYFLVLLVRSSASYTGRA